MKPLITIEDINNIIKTKSAYEDKRKGLERILNLRGGTLYYQGHSSTEIDTCELPYIKDAVVKYYYSNCEIILQQLTNLGVDTKAEEEKIKLLVL